MELERQRKNEGALNRRNITDVSSNN